MQQKKIYKLCLAGLFAALIAVLTAFVKIPTGINSGYVHVGDSLIYLSGCLLGPYGILSSAIGGAFADILAGAPVWAIPTAIIKALNCLPFVIVKAGYKKRNKPFKALNFMTVFMTAVSALITVGGYFIAESLIYSVASAVTSIPFSFIQGLGSAVVFVIVAEVSDKLKIHKRTGG